MRIKIHALTALVLGICGSALASNPTLDAMRGFHANKCYEHHSVIRCKQTFCYIEVFPMTRARLGFAIVQGPNEAKPTEGIGVFRFRLIAGKKKSLHAVVLSKRIVNLRRFIAQANTPETQAKEVACASAR
ncbi:MAG: hypothetical protein AB1540_11395 [Bdellovibrionota bacterium]